MTDFGKSLIQATNEALAFARGEMFVRSWDEPIIWAWIAPRSTVHGGSVISAVRYSYVVLPQWIDPDDAPEWTDEMFARADLYHGDKLIRRGRK